MQHAQHVPACTVLCCPLQRQPAMPCSPPAACAFAMGPAVASLPIPQPLSPGPPSLNRFPLARHPLRWGICGQPVAHIIAPSGACVSATSIPMPLNQCHRPPASPSPAPPQMSASAGRRRGASKWSCGQTSAPRPLRTSGSCAPEGSGRLDWLGLFGQPFCWFCA